MRASALVALATAVVQVSALHIARQPHHARHAELARGLVEQLPKPENVTTPRRLKRSNRCASKTSSSSLASTSSSQSSAVNVGSNPSSTSTSTSQASSSSTSATKTSSGSGTTQNAAIPTATRATASDPYLKSLSIPVDYNKISAFTESHTGDLTFYGQGLVSCGDTYDDSTFTAAVSHIMYDAWPGADTSATNENTVCGTFVQGRYFITSADEVVPGSSHATMGGDGILACTPGEQCHCPLTATVYNPETGISVTVSVVDRCEGCANDDIDLAPAPFLKLTRPGIDLSQYATSDLMTEALKDPEGRHHNITWTFNTSQQYACSVHRE